MSHAETPQDLQDTRLWSVGASVGTSFVVPWFTGTVRGTIAPWDHLFFELGLDIGLVSGKDGIGHYSLCPYVTFNYYLPIKKWVGWYAGLGWGYTFANFSFDEGNVQKNDFVMDVVSGFNILNFLDLSYTLRTNFARVSNKLSVGYIYRF